MSGFRAQNEDGTVIEVPLEVEAHGGEAIALYLERAGYRAPATPAPPPEPAAARPAPAPETADALVTRVLAAQAAPKPTRRRAPSGDEA